MTRFWIPGILAGLLSASLGTNHAIAQVPTPAGDFSGGSTPAFLNSGQDPALLPPVPPTLPVPQQNDDIQLIPSPEHPSFEPPPRVEPKYHPEPKYYPEPTQNAALQNPDYYGPVAVPGVNSGPTAWQPGGYSARRGRPYYYTTPERDRPLYTVHKTSGTPWAIDHSAYQYHFGPGYYRNSEGGHYRFPYYTYRAPWYFPGHPIYNRDTNRPW